MSRFIGLPLKDVKKNESGEPVAFTWHGVTYRGPFLTGEACAYLVQQGVALVGIDCANIDNTHDSTRPAHTTLLAAGVPIVEHMTALDGLPASGFRFFAVPPAIAGGTSFPVRAFAIWG